MQGPSNIEDILVFTLNNRVLLSKQEWKGMIPFSLKKAEKDNSGALSDQTYLILRLNCVRIRE